MQKHFLLIPFLLATSSLATAQKKPQKEKPLEIEFGKIPAEDIKMTTYSLDSSAEAVVLASKGSLSIDKNFDGDLDLTYVFFRRVKLLKKSAFDGEGRVKISYRTKDRMDDLRKVKAAIIQSDGTRQELTKKDFFEEKSSADWMTKKIVFPNLAEGAIIEYQYEIVSTYRRFNNLYDWQFQENIPVRYSELSLSIPEYFEYVYLFRGRQPLKKAPIKNEVVGGNMRVSIQKLYADSVPALKPEGYITTMTDYLTQINFQLSRINHPGGRTEEVMTNWKKVAEDLMDNSYIGKQFQKKSNYGDVWRAVKPLLVDAKTDDEKIRIIYEYLCQNISWADDQYSIYADESLNDAFKKKKARSGELNMMLLACLSEVGIKASPMLVSTRSHGKPVTIYPILEQFDHLVCHIDRDGKPLIIDVGNIHRSVGLPRVQTLNEQGWLLDKNDPHWVPIVPSLSNEVSLASFKLSDDGTLVGSISTNYGGYTAVSERENETDAKDEKTKKALMKDFPDIKIDSITVANLNKPSEVFKRIVYCSIPNAATVAGDLIYIKPALKTDFDENPFKQAEREYPVEFPYPFKDQFVLNLTIPVGYVVDEMPKSIKVNLPENGGSFQYISSETNNVIHLVIKIQLGQLRFEPESYALVKQFFSQIATKSAEQIVLKKKSK
jgi:Domain of Unknown Function with PDB structure (DUF3857)